MYIRVFEVSDESQSKAAAEHRIKRRFCGMDELEYFTGSREIDPADYTLAFEGHVKADSLEGIYQDFNSYLHLRSGRCMSVSDVVEVVEGTDRTEPGYYFCNRIGFDKIPFGRA